LYNNNNNIPVKKALSSSILEENVSKKSDNLTDKVLINKKSNFQPFSSNIHQSVPIIESNEMNINFNNNNNNESDDNFHDLFLSTISSIDSLEIGTLHLSSGNSSLSNFFNMSTKRKNCDNSINKHLNEQKKLEEKRIKAVNSCCELM
jgi:hypothetical protein